MTPLLTRRNLYAAALCVGGAALLLHPACVIPLGVGAMLGYRGKGWLQQYLDK